MNAIQLKIFVLKINSLETIGKTVLSEQTKFQLSEIIGI